MTLSDSQHPKQALFVNFRSSFLSLKGLMLCRCSKSFELVTLAGAVAGKLLSFLIVTISSNTLFTLSILSGFQIEVSLLLL